MSERDLRRLLVIVASCLVAAGATLALVLIWLGWGALDRGEFWPAVSWFVTGVISAGVAAVALRIAVQQAGVLRGGSLPPGQPTPGTLDGNDDPREQS